MQLERQPQAICWHEGMLLSPQHFQQNHIYWETQLQNLRANLAPYSWGLIELKFDPARLMQGDIFITRLQAIMPDGLMITHDAEYDSELRISLADVVELNEHGKVMVHLAIPIRVPGSASESGIIQRFETCEGQPVVDDNTGEGELVMARLRPKLALQAVSNVSKKYIAIPLFEVLLPDEGNYQLGNYCPPILNLGADSFRREEGAKISHQPLQLRCQTLALALRKKARLLAGFSEDDDGGLGERVSAQHRQWIRAMVKDLIEFELMADNAENAPLALYQALARMTASMSELDPCGIPPKLPRYQHDNILPGFDTALDYINEQLARVNLNYSSIIFDEGRSGLFSLIYDKAWAGKDLLIELTGRNENSRSELVEWFESCRIASSKMHKELARQRLLGAQVSEIEYDEKTGLSAAPGSALFRVKQSPQFIKPGQPLVINCTNEKVKSAQPKRIRLHLPHE